MLTLEDCIALSGLTREEIDAIAEHEHLPEIIAMEMGAYLLQLPEGGKAIKGIIRDDIARARMHGDYVHSAKLKLVLRHFIEHCSSALLKDETVERPAASRRIFQG